MSSTIELLVKRFSGHPCKHLCRQSSNNLPWQDIFIRKTMVTYLGVLLLWILFNIFYLQTFSSAPKGEPWASRLAHVCFLCSSSSKKTQDRMFGACVGCSSKYRGRESGAPPPADRIYFFSLGVVFRISGQLLCLKFVRKCCCCFSTIAIKGYERDHREF